MAQRNTPAPRRAGTATIRSCDRQAREAAVIVMLEEIRHADPEAFGKAMELLAMLCARSEIAEK